MAEKNGGYDFKVKLLFLNIFEDNRYNIVALYRSNLNRMENAQAVGFDS